MRGSVELYDQAPVWIELSVDPTASAVARIPLIQP